MYILFGILAILFGGLHSIAAYYQLRQPEHPAETHLMLAGGVSTLWAGIMSLLSIGSGDFVIATLGAVMIIAAAILNGKKAVFHLRHHIVRISIAVIIVIGLFFT